MSSGGKSLVPHGGLTSTTASASPCVEAASPWVSVEEDAEKKRRRRPWMWRRENETARQVGLRSKRGRRRRRCRSDGDDDNAAIDSTPLQIGAAASNRWEKAADGAAEIMRCDSLLGRAAGPHQAEAH